MPQLKALLQPEVLIPAAIIGGGAALMATGVGAPVGAPMVAGGAGAAGAGGAAAGGGAMGAGLGAGVGSGIGVGAASGGAGTAGLFGNAAIGSMLAGTVTQALGQQQQMSVQQATQRYNMGQAELAGDQAVQQASLEAARAAAEGRRFIGAQRSAQSGSGLEMDSGSALALRAKALEQNRLDQLAILYGGQIAKTRAYAEAGLQKANAQATNKARPWALGSTLLQGGSYAALTQQQMKGG